MSAFLANLWSANSKRDEEWDPHKKITIAFRGMEYAGEVGELLNQLKKLARLEAGLVGSSPDYNKLYEEIGDSMICLSLICHHIGITAADFERMVTKKFNRTSRERNLSTFLPE